MSCVSVVVVVVCAVWCGTLKRSKPTLANPTLANVKVLVVCKDFGFSELIVWVFLKLIVQVFFVCFELTWVGGER